MRERISKVGRGLAIATFVILLGVGILAFVMTLNVREETMPPIPSTEWYMHDMKHLGDQVKDYVREDDEGEESEGTAPEGESDASVDGGDAS